MTHPADELHVVRSEILALEIRAEELRLKVLALPPKERSSARTLVTVSEQTRTTFDSKQFKIDYFKLWGEYAKPKTITYVKVERK